MNPRATDGTVRLAQVGMLCLGLGLVLGLLVTVDHLFWHRTWAGPLLLMGLGFGLLTFYRLYRAQRWAIIPTGVLFTLAAVDWLHRVSPQVRDDWLFFLGLGITFGAAYVTGGGRPRTAWAWAAAAASGLISLPSIGGLLEFLPLLLLAAGLFLLLRTLRQK